MGNISKIFNLMSDFTLLDGAMGTQLIKRGLKIGEHPELINLSHPDLITSIHREYIDAGSQIIYTNTFGCNRKNFENTQYDCSEIIIAAIKNAKLAAENSNCKIALDIGPIGEMLEPNGTLSFDEAYEIFKEQVLIGASLGVDLIVFETMTDLLELKVAILAAKENSNLPIFATMSFEKNGRTFSGVSPETFGTTVNRLGVDAIGINCSLGPIEILPIMNTLAKHTNLPLILKANAGIPHGEKLEYEITPKDYARCIKEFVDIGVTIFGGCCGTTPEYIGEIKTSISELKPNRKPIKLPTAVCSSTRYLPINQVRVIGEKINPTGKKLLQKALLEREYNYVIREAIEQVDNGAEILDINLGFPGMKESDAMADVVKGIQSVLDVPLQIDSANKEAIELGLRYYNGKPIINSVNGQKNSLEAILPLAKKYGAAVVGLTFDENGIPDSVEKRFKVAKRILDAAIDYGIPKEDVFIDTLTLTVSSESNAAQITLDTLERVKKELGLKTLLGVSNISFGLPYRELINSTFLNMALTKGLDLPILNPSSEDMMDSIRTFKVLWGQDEGCKAYLDAYAKEPRRKVNHIKKSDISNEELVRSSIIKGISGPIIEATNELLENYDSMTLINEILIPALDAVGERFEREEIFLPQLIKSASCAQEAFDAIKAKLVEADKTIPNKGKIVLATVKGDIHDIGKNITKVILENYGYQIIDLGKDVDKETIVENVKSSSAKLVGLSALMTTTLINMEETIELLKQEVPDCAIMVGGAVLNLNYSKVIGADYYVSDSKMSVEVAKKIYC